jgi:hypothetical protein
VRAYVRVPLLAAVAAAAVTVLSGAQSAPERVTTVAADAPGVQQGPLLAEGFRSARTYQQVARPVRIRIASMNVDSRLIDLGLQKDGSVEVPEAVDVAGWFDQGPRPGQAGPAVILGHVDSKSSPGIFFDLVDAKKGTLIRIDRADGTSVRFAITHVERVPKTRFPTDLVYAPSLEPTLRLVTCGGTFDHSRKSYRDNVIAFAELV